VAKVFQGGSEKQILDVLKRNFTSVRHAKPPSSRKESSELYVVAKGFKGAPKLLAATEEAPRQASG
jgi:23S rRNA (uridine2552-2'-O)-methyltransferase